MKRRTVLFVMTVTTSDAEITQIAEVAAQNETHLTCLILGAAPTLPAYAYGAPPYGTIAIPPDWNDTVKSIRKTHEDRVQSVGALLAKTGASGHVQLALCGILDMKHIVARHARVSDEAVFATNLNDKPEFMREAAAGILFHSPIAFRINGTLSQDGARIFVAWDSSEAASSAVHAALPHLQSASEVVIACIDPVTTSDRDGQDPGTDVAAWLSHHGCNVTVSQYPSGDGDIAQCILDRAKEFGADLVVMGAYGHTRMIQTIFGGTTRTMIGQTTLPVLFAN